MEQEDGVEGLAPFGHHAALDGLRGLAVLVVIAFHLDLPWARGGFLGVDLFFVLSGFLITTLLVREWHGEGGIALGAFWARRLRRLVPALLLTLALVAVFTRAELDPWLREGVRDDGLASLLYVANWRFIVDQQGYFGLFAAPSPLRHMWSLAIEEQFYVVWPVVVLVALRAGRGRLRVLAGVCGAGIVASVAVMAWARGDDQVLRAYYGTDARAHTILVGALLALVLVRRPATGAAARVVAAAGPVGLVVVAVAWATASGTGERYYRGGSLAYALVAALLVAACVQRGPLARVLAVTPLAWVGRLSYGLYLFHWPLIVWLVPTRAPVDGLALDALRVGLTFALAVASHHLLELPVRDRRVPAVRFAGVATTLATVAGVLVSAGGATPAPSYLVGERPAGEYEDLSIGDPVFCGEPRTDEVEAAIDTADDLGPPALPASADGLRVLLLGDSTACSLYPGLAAVGRAAGADVAQGSVFGCGIASGHVTSTRGEQVTPNSDRCPDLVARALDPALREQDPDVVVWMSIWEKSDLVVDGTPVSATSEAGRSEVLARMDAALARITERGARVVVVTVAAPAPNDASGLDNTSNEVDDAGYVRLDELLATFADRHPDDVTLVDLAERVCPGGPPCPEEVDGRRLRPDGRHFTPEAAAVVGRWLFPAVVEAAYR